jgi:Domain of unknown function (DUF4338)
MNVLLRYRGREITSHDAESIRKLIKEHPDASRRALSFEVCAAWKWFQENGAPRDMVCRGLLLQLHRAGHITLPPSRWAPGRRPPRRSNRSVELPEISSAPLIARLDELGSIEIRQVRRTAQEAVVESLIEQHHYLGYARPVGEHLKYLVTAEQRPIACFCWSSAPRHLGPRDRYIGWSQAARKANVRFVAYQSRFLILPWVRVPHLASHLLGRMSKRLSADWEDVYAHPIFFTETFVDPSRYRGTCYRAANWTYLGMTTGRGNNAPTMQQTRPLKQLFGYALVKDFRRRLCGID